jgi:competence protein ComEC
MTDRSGLLRTGGILTLCLVFLLSVIIGIIYRRHRPSQPRPRLLAAFLDVGNGDCTLIRTPSGHAILVDAGPASAGPLIVNTLRRQGVHTLDLLVLAAPSPNSIGGVPGLLNSGIAVTQVWEGQHWGNGAAVRAAQQAVQEHHVPILIAQGGDTETWGAAHLTALWPPAHGARIQSGTLICRLDFGDSKFVLAGPADAKDIRYLVADVGDALDCDVLQVAAGGANGATLPELLRRATPSVAVISCATDTPPGQMTLQRLEAAGAAVWRTDAQGAITIFVDGHTAPIVTASHLSG